MVLRFFKAVPLRPFDHRAGFSVVRQDALQAYSLTLSTFLLGLMRMRYLGMKSGRNVHANSGYFLPFLSYFFCRSQLEGLMLLLC